MNKQEAGVTAKINKWLQSMVKSSCPFEIKHTRGKTRFNLSELKEHQRNWLLAATTKRGCTWKIPDTGYGYNPFDSFHFKNSDAYVVIQFPTWVCAIEIRDLLKVTTSSITEDRAGRISRFRVLSKDL